MQGQSKTSRKARLLLVDDKVESLDALVAVLANSNYELVCCTSGEDALRQLLDHTFDLILLDVRMPGMDGFDTARRISEREKTRAVPIIFITGESQSAADVVQGYALQAVDYILKPIDAQMLRAKVAMVLEKHRVIGRPLVPESP